jgi:hypothetical protein
VGYLIGIVLLGALVAWAVVRPLLRDPALLERTEDEHRAALEAAKEAKYREIRDAELDRRMGKLSEADWHATDRELRAQAIEILKEIDALPPLEPDSADAADPVPATAESPAPGSTPAKLSPR